MGFAMLVWVNKGEKSVKEKLKIIYFLYEGWYNSRKGLLKLYYISKPLGNSQINRFKTNVINVQVVLVK